MNFNPFHKTKSSLKEQHDKYAAGASTFSKSIYRFPEAYPNFIKSAKGCTLTDINNKTYTDYVSALGAISIGYNDKYINNAVINQINKGNLFSLISDIEPECAEFICKKTKKDKCLFVKTGTDSVNAAIRLAKAYTDRPTILYCNHGYHGWGSEFGISQSINKGVNTELKQHMIPFEYNNIEQLESLLTDNIAAVLLEPVTYTNPDTGYLHELLEVVHDNNSLVIADEIVTYPRFSKDLYTFQQHCDADIVCIGKGISNGYSFSAVVGNGDILKQRQNEEVFISGTMFGENIGMVATMKTLEIANHKNLSGHIWKMGSLLQEKFNKLAEEKNVPISLYGLAPRMVFKYPDNSIKSLFLQETANENIIWGNIVYINLSHTQKIIENTLDKCSDVLDIISSAIEQGIVDEMIIGRHVKDLNLRK